MALSMTKILDSKMAKAFSVGGALNAAFTYKDYKDARAEGYTVAGAGFKALGTNIMYDVVGMGPMLAFQAAEAVPKLAVKGYEGVAKMSRDMSRQSMNRPFQNATYVDTQQNYTMRQAGLTLAKASKYNMQQSMMGNEASYMHL